MFPSFEEVKILEYFGLFSGFLLGLFFVLFARFLNTPKSGLFSGFFQGFFRAFFGLFSGFFLIRTGVRRSNISDF